MLGALGVLGRDIDDELLERELLELDELRPMLPAYEVVTAPRIILETIAGMMNLLNFMLAPDKMLLYDKADQMSIFI